LHYALVIPVYNERRWLPRVIDRLDAVPPPPGMTRRIILVDDGSKDGTGDLVRGFGQRPDITAVVHERNRGKGAALRTGFEAALSPSLQGGPVDAVLVHDADLEYDPADHAALLTPLADKRADAVIGTRFLGQTHRVLYFWHSIANGYITLLSNMLTNLNLTDIECCSKGFTRDVLSRIRVEEDRFGVEPELVAKMATMRVPRDDMTEAATPADGHAKRRLRIYEVPVSYAGRTYDEGKKIKPIDGVRALWCILKYNILR
jgi:glycosyltransferase involved in cell wall biosynthesis